MWIKSWSLFKIYYNARTISQVELEQKKLEEGIHKQKQLEQEQLEQEQLEQGKLEQKQFKQGKLEQG